MNFNNNKKTFLAKTDKSKKGFIDEKIAGLVNALNSCRNYYSTSSCSGRIVLLKDESGRKDKAEWLFVSHEPADYKAVESAAGRVDGLQGLWFKFEPPIVHVACRTIEDSQKLLDIARPLFKLTGIISTSKNIVEIRGTDRIDVPLEAVFDMKLLVEEANSKLKNGWKKLAKLETLLLSLKTGN
jgi:tRNA wybutosine-synthesizing protein 3